MKLLRAILLGINIALSMACNASDGTRQLPDIQLEVAIVPLHGYAGQKRQLEVTVLTDSWFSGGNEFPQLDIDRALTRQPEGFAVNFSVEKNGNTYAAQQRIYDIFPNVAGRFVTPPISVLVKVAASGNNSLSSRHVIQLMSHPPVVFEVDKTLVNPPPEIYASNFQIKSSFDLSLKNIKAGDVLTREIIITAEDSLGLLLPAIELASNKSYRIYALPAEISEHVNRGMSTSESRQIISYVFDRSGDYQLDEVLINWWNINTQSMEYALLPAVEIQVYGATNIFKKYGHLILYGMIFLVSITLLTFIYRHFNGSVKSTEHIEARLFKRLNKACKHSDNIFIRQYYLWESSFKNQYGEVSGPIKSLYPLSRSLFSIIKTPIQEVDRRIFINELSVYRSKAIALKKKKLESKLLPTLNSKNYFPEYY